MALQARQIIRNMLFNWLGTLVSMVVGFFFSPYILHRLGDVAYGVWVMAVSIVAYLQMLDLGLQSSVLRYVSKGKVQGDHAAASESLSGALWIRVRISLVVLLAAGVLSYVFPAAFKVPAALAHPAQIAVLLIGLSTAINMSFGCMGGVLSGLNRYDLQTYITLVQTAIRITGVVLALRTGHGIVAIAAVELFSWIVANALLWTVGKRIYPELKIRFAKPSPEVLRKLWSYSAYAFLTTVAVQLVYQSDNLVVGAFVSATAVTFYAIANSLCRYAGQIVSAVAGTLVPAASTYEAAGDNSALVNLYRHGTRATLLVSMPVLVTFILRGGTFIRLWMGAEYAHSSGLVLILLSVPLFFAYANRPVSALAYGMEKHKLMAYWAIGEGVANLTLSIWLVHPLGIYGVAIGTMVPNLIAQLGFAPWYATRLVGVSLRDVYLRTWLPVFASAVPFAAASWLLERYAPPQHLVSFFGQVVLCLPVLLLTLALTYRDYVRRVVMPRLQAWLLPRRANA